MTQRPINVHKAYHAHIYFGPETAGQALALREAAGSALKVSVGRFHEKLVGPHPHWSCQLAFSHNEFDAVIPWLEAHRNGLDIFVHGLTGNDLEDHTTHAYWLGNPSRLDLSVFQQSL
ncbi:MAG: 4,5-dioxygenase [Burkholderiales bacterium]|nr:MAG: 4,5-dioxygenase [Burkholderiales bacterium]